MTTVAFHPPFVKTSYVKVIMLRKALFPTPGKQGFTFSCGFLSFCLITLLY
ncbi:hypothetical protein QFZ51_000467 [Chitinophaga sp. W3I9]